jgi:hypothetical protein
MNNQPAFPMVAKDKTGMIINMGMSLRDYFAAQAMQALIARETTFSSNLMLYTGAAYDFADAMMEAREA